MQAEWQGLMDELKSLLDGNEENLTIVVRPADVAANVDEMCIATGDYKSVDLAADLLKRELSDAGINVKKECLWQLSIEGSGKVIDRLQENISNPVKLAKVKEYRVFADLKNRRSGMTLEDLEKALSSFAGVDFSQGVIRYLEDDPEKDAIEKAIWGLFENC